MRQFIVSQWLATEPELLCRLPQWLQIKLISLRIGGAEAVVESEEADKAAGLVFYI